MIKLCVCPSEFLHLRQHKMQCLCLLTINLLSCTLGAVLTPTTPPPSSPPGTADVQKQSSSTESTITQAQLVLQSDNRVERATSPSSISTSSSTASSFSAPYPALSRKERSVQLDNRLSSASQQQQYKYKGHRYTSEDYWQRRQQQAAAGSGLSDQQLSWQLEPQVGGGKRPKRLPGPAQLVEAAIESVGHSAAGAVLDRNGALLFLGGKRPLPNHFFPSVRFTYASMHSINYLNQ